MRRVLFFLLVACGGSGDESTDSDGHQPHVSYCEVVTACSTEAGDLEKCVSDAAAAWSTADMACRRAQDDLEACVADLEVCAGFEEFKSPKRTRCVAELDAWFCDCIGDHPAGLDCLRAARPPTR